MAKKIKRETDEEKLKRIQSGSYYHYEGGEIGNKTGSTSASSMNALITESKRRTEEERQNQISSIKSNILTKTKNAGFNAEFSSLGKGHDSEGNYVDLIGNELRLVNDKKIGNELWKQNNKFRTAEEIRNDNKNVLLNPTKKQFNDENANRLNKKKAFDDFLLNDEDILNDVNELGRLGNPIKMPEVKKTTSYFKKADGNVVQNVFGSLADFGINVVKGFLNRTENVADALSYQAAWLAEHINPGGGKASGLRKRAAKNSVDALFGENYNNLENIAPRKVLADGTLDKSLSEKVDQYSYFDEGTDNISRFVGEQLATIAMSKTLDATGLAKGLTNIQTSMGIPIDIATKRAGALSMGLVSYESAYGGTYSALKNAGYSDKEAASQARISGIVEAISEQLHDGIPGTTTAGWADNITNKFVKSRALKTVFNALGEADEEIFGNILTTAVNEVYRVLDKDNQYLKDNYTGNFIEDVKNNGESFDDLLGVFISTLITGAASNLGTNINAKQIIKDYAKENNIKYETAARRLGLEISVDNEITTAKQRLYDGTIEAIENNSATPLTDTNKSQIELIVYNLKDNQANKISPDAIVDIFNQFKDSQINNFQNEAMNLYGSKLGGNVQTAFNDLVNDISQIIYDTGVDVKFDNTLDVPARMIDNTIFLNPEINDENFDRSTPIRTIFLHQLAGNYINEDIKKYVIKELKNRGEFETIREDLFDKGFTEENYEIEMVAQELDKIFQDENGLQKLSQNNGVFSNIKNQLTQIGSKLTRNRATRDAAYLSNLINKFNNVYDGNVPAMNDLSYKEIVFNENKEKLLESKETVERETILNVALNMSRQFKHNSSYVRNERLETISGNNKNPIIIKLDNKIYDAETKQIKKDLLKELTNKKVNIIDINENAILSKTGVKKVLSSQPFSISKDLENLIKNSIYGFTTKNDGSDNLIYHHNFFNVVDVDGERKILRSILREFAYQKDNNLYYYQSTFEDIRKTEDSQSSLSSKMNDIDYFESSVRDSTISQNNNEVNSEDLKTSDNINLQTPVGTYLEPTTPIKDTEKSQKYLKSRVGEDILSKGYKTQTDIYTAWFDKINPIQKLQDISGNKYLYAKYNNRGMSSGTAQYQIGVAQTDSKGNQIGKSINDIFLPVENAGLTTEFDDYLAHRLNVERYDKVPVWDETITPEISQEAVDSYEARYPQFVEWANDVYKFNDNQLQKMIEAGLAAENARDWLYDNYVSISRDLKSSVNPLVVQPKGVKVKSPIRKAKGSTLEMRPMKEAMAQQVIRTERAIADNIAGNELLNVLGGTVGDKMNLIGEENGKLNALEKNSDGTYNYTIYKNGVPVQMKITKDIAKAISPSKVYEYEKLFTPAKKVGGLLRTVLTDKNPMFILTNFFKDAGDAMLNTKYTPADYLYMYPQAVSMMAKNSKEFQQYKALGGLTNTYFDTKEGEVKQPKTKVGKMANKALNAIEEANSFIEQAPRFTEYLNTLKHGGTIQEALYNSAEITTNFARGGEVAKVMNRNGAIFLNASIQGFDKQIRNFTGQNGAKGYINLLGKVIALGIIPAALNNWIYDDDEDYEELPDYVKNSYFLFKTGDKKFIRIPKGRAVSVFGTATRHTMDVAGGKQNVGDAVKDTFGQFINNVAPNNPLEQNVISPIFAVSNNKSWSGGKIVSTSLQNMPEAYQYDERTSSIAKFLGKTFNYSPKKIDYLLDQYTGGIGDIILPMTTPAAEHETNIPLLTPLKDKFTVDSTISNKYVSKFYEEKDKLDKEMKLVDNIDESDKTMELALRQKFMTNVNTQLSELYKEKRAVQNNTAFDDKEKYNRARDIQRKIDDLAKFAVQDFDSGYYTDNYAIIGDQEYYTEYSKGKLTWTKVNEDTKAKQEKYASDYLMSPEVYYSMKPTLQQTITGTNAADYQKYASDLTDIRNNTKNDKEETIKYINNLNISIPQKALFIREYYKSFNNYNDEIFNYVKSLNISDEEKKAILIRTGFEYDKKTGSFSWK